MSDLISREELLKAFASVGSSGAPSYVTKNYIQSVITNAHAIEQGEPVAELKITWGSDTGYEYGLTLIGGALASQKEYDDWIVSNFKGDGVFKLYTTPQQTQSVADALEEAAKLVEGITGYTQFQTEAHYQVTYSVANKIRALIKRNVPKEGE